MSKTFLSGKYISQEYYKAFIPNEINRDWEINDMQVLNLLSQPDRHLGRMDCFGIGRAYYKNLGLKNTWSNVVRPNDKMISLIN